MGETTAISWCDHTFNPWIGCTKVSTGEQGACEHCYAEVATPSRALGVLWGNHARHRTAPSNWAQPSTWDRKAEAAGKRPFVFCASLADVFDNQVDPEWRRDLFDLIQKTPNLTWLLLTKRPQNILRLFAQAIDGNGDDLSALPEAWPRNAAIGCTVVTQEEADRDIPKLLAAKGALHPAFAFVSMEPLMGPVDLRAFMWPVCGWWRGPHNSLEEAIAAGAEHGYRRQALVSADRQFLDWVITGGETDQGGQAARPSNPDWFRALRDQCAVAGVPFHHKQNGEFCQFGEHGHLADGSLNFLGRPDDVDTGHRAHFGDVIVQKVGKKRAGRLIDGVLHDARPRIPA